MHTHSEGLANTCIRLSHTQASEKPMEQWGSQQETLVV